MDASPTAAPARPVARFLDLLPEIRALSSQAPDLSARVDQVLSFGGRFPLELGRRSLSTRQRAWMAVLGARQDFASDEGLFPPGKGAGLRLGMRSYGRLVLEPSPSYGQGDLDFGFLPLSLPEQEEAQSRHASLRAGWEDACAETDALLTQGAQDKLAAAAEMLDHIDPVLIYVEEATFTLFDRHNNLMEERKTGGPRFLFSALKGLEPGQWSPEERAFVACLWILGQAGLRGEEFNGRQLGPLELREQLIASSARLAKALEKPAPENGEASLAELAAAHKGLKEEARGSHLIARWVHGLNFYKEERLIPKAALPRRVEALDRELGSYLQESSGLEAPDPRSAFGPWLALALRGNCRSRNPELLHPVEDMVQFLVEQAAALLEADIAMSRGLRRLRSLVEAQREGRYREACLWPITEYFCCAAPSPAMLRMGAAKPGLLFTVLNAVAQRMNYNSWHYMPGHFPAGERPEGRHFYLPPRMPDTAEWSNLHHAGHVLANVLYSIRSPGELICEGRAYPGLFDLRLMRQSGRPFSPEELGLAVAVTGYLGAFYQALMDLSARDGEGPYFCVDAFDKAWYQRAYP